MWLLTTCYFWCSKNCLKPCNFCLYHSYFTRKFVKILFTRFFNRILRASYFLCLFRWNEWSRYVMQFTHTNTITAIPKYHYVPWVHICASIIIFDSHSVCCRWSIWVKLSSHCVKTSFMFINDKHIHFSRWRAGCFPIYLHENQWNML